MYVCFLPFFSVFILSLLFRLLLIHAQYTHTRARTSTHCSIAFTFFSFQRLRVCVSRAIFFLSLFRNWPSDLLLSLFLPTLVYNAVLSSSSSSVCHCDLFLLYSFSLSLLHSCSFFGVHSLYLAFTLSLTQSKLVFSLPLLQHISRVASNKKRQISEHTRF